ncbi:MAG: hypothetical protein ACPHJ3_05045, partial [Rubripirellula sp.]
MKPTLKFFPTSLLVVLLAIFQQTVRADVSLPGFFGDHMVMQRDVEIRVWGWCDAGEKVSVTLDGKEA